MTTMALDRFAATTAPRRSHRTRSEYLATPVRMRPEALRTPLIDVREMDNKSFRLACLIVKPLVLAVMLTVAWQIGLVIGQVRL